MKLLYYFPEIFKASLGNQGWLRERDNFSHPSFSQMATFSIFIIKTNPKQTLQILIVFSI